MSDDGRDRVPLGVNLWKSSQNWLGVDVSYSVVDNDVAQKLNHFCMCPLNSNIVVRAALTGLRRRRRQRSETIALHYRHLRDVIAKQRQVGDGNEHTVPRSGREAYYLHGMISARALIA